MAYQRRTIIVDELGDSIRIPIVHGDTLTAATVVMQIEKVVQKQEIERVVFISGATSKIGRAVTIELARRHYRVFMYTKSQDRFERIRDEAEKWGKNIAYASSLAEGEKCMLWITGKAIPDGTKLLDNIPFNACVLNFSVPNPVTKKHLKKRRDIFSREVGLLAYDPSRTNLRITMRLKPGITYACHAGTIVHASKGWTNHEVSSVEIGNMWKVWEAAMDEGFFLPPLD